MMLANGFSTAGTSTAAQLCLSAGIEDDIKLWAPTAAELQPLPAKAAEVKSIFIGTWWMPSESIFVLASDPGMNMQTIRANRQAQQRPRVRAVSHAAILSSLTRLRQANDGDLIPRHATSH